MAKDPEDKLLRRISRNVEPREGRSKKGSAVAIAKSRGLVKQSNGSLAPTDKGRKAIRKIDRRSSRRS